MNPIKKKGILVEGCDCSGKTTLVRTLKSRLFTEGWDVLDVGHRSGDQFERYAKIYANADRLIMDRGHFSELIYGTLRRTCPFEPSDLQFLNNFARKYFVVILTDAPPKELLRRYRERNYAQTTKHKELGAVCKEFLRLMNIPDVLHYVSCDEKALMQTVETILEKI
jgi:thymidylate kinase